MSVITLTEDDLHSVRYFIKEKGNITRWVHWEEKGDAILAINPQLKEAFRAQENAELQMKRALEDLTICLLYTSPSPRDRTRARMPSSA